MSLRLLLIINPVAGLNTPLRTEEIVRRSLRRRGIDATVETALTEEPGHAFRLARDARNAYDVVAAVGGDGTVREVAGGLMGGTAPLAILPNGTANVLAADLGIPFTFKRAVDLIAPHAPTVPLDMGEMNGRPFALNVGVGYAARLINGTPTFWKRRVGFVAYLPSAVRAAFVRDRAQSTVTVGGETYTGRVQMVFIANSGGIGGWAVRIAPDIHPTDGKLVVAIFAPRPAVGMLASFMQLVLRRYTAITGVTYWTGTEVTVTSDPPLPVQVDGDPAGVTPCTIRLSPAALSVIVPASVEKKPVNRREARALRRLARRSEKPADTEG